LSLSHKAPDLFVLQKGFQPDWIKKALNIYSVIRHSVLLMYNAHFNHNF